MVPIDWPVWSGLFVALCLCLAIAWLWESRRW